MCFVKYFNCGDFGWFACGGLMNLFPPAKQDFNNSVQFNAFASKAATSAVIMSTPVMI